MFVDVSNWYNYPEHRTIYNTNRHFFNCGGYALGNFGWYWPAADKDEQMKIDSLFQRKAYHKADKIMVNRIFEDFPELVEVKAEWIRNHEIDYKKFEIIAFRSAHRECWDFHFRKLGANGRWYEKCGGDYKIYDYNYDSIFDIWNGMYNGKIYFFARRRPRK